jgi:hypothetical protein
MKNNILIVLLIIIGILFIQRECSRPSGEIITPDPIIIWKYDSIPVIDSVPYPVPIVETIWDTVWRYREIDTLAILRDYFAFRIYEDTIINSSELLVAVRDSVHQNRLWGSRIVTYQNFRPVDAEVICPECPKPTHKLFIGGTVLGNISTFGAGPSLGLVTKKDNMYTYTYDVINKTHNISTYWKIYFK